MSPDSPLSAIHGTILADVEDPCLVGNVLPYAVYPSETERYSALAKQFVEPILEFTVKQLHIPADSLTIADTDFLRCFVAENSLVLAAKLAADLKDVNPPPRRRT